MSNPTGVKWFDALKFPNFWYGFAANKKEWRKIMKHLKIDNEPYPLEEGVGARITTFDKGNAITCILTISDDIDEKTSAVEIMALIGHEAVHVWQSLRKHIGENEPSIEFEAYMIQSIMLDLGSQYEWRRKVKAIAKLK